MMHAKHDPVSKLVFELSKLPGIGEKTATRLAYFILKQDSSYAQALSDAVLSAKQKMHLCSLCLTFTDIDPCRICSNTNKDAGVICVVERPSDVFSIEQAGVHSGTYHVLHGVLSPLDGIGPDELKIRELLGRIAPNSTRAPVKEIILAMNPSVEGEATSLYLSKLILPFGIKLTRLAYGLPMGGMIEYSDRQTLSKAIQNRVEMTL